jgi:hypothetical protein
VFNEWKDIGILLKETLKTLYPLEGDRRLLMVGWVPSEHKKPNSSPNRCLET